jgi:hypothetical protein
VLTNTRNPHRGISHAITHGAAHRRASSLAPSRSYRHLRVLLPDRQRCARSEGALPGEDGRAEGIPHRRLGFRFEHAAAVDYAIQLEEKANRLPGGVQ